MADRIECPNCGNSEYFEVHRHTVRSVRLYFWDTLGYEEVEAEGFFERTVMQLTCPECNTILSDDLLWKLLENSFRERQRAKGLEELVSP